MLLPVISFLPLVPLRAQSGRLGSPCVIANVGLLSRVVEFCGSPGTGCRERVQLEAYR